jgi:phosphoglycolate phosphatase-like HAD superfamily hydrolase
MLLRGLALAALLAAVACTPAASQRPDDPLPSWNDGTAKQQIVTFVNAVTAPGSPTFVPVAERTATIDNDGTLWVEKPTYIQVYFILERIKALAPQHPEWSTTQPFKAVLDNDLAQLEQLGEQELLELVAATSTGMTQEQYEAELREFFTTWRHPRFHVGFADLYYQPMVELLAYLRENGFKTYIVTGGGIDFVRQVAPTIYGIPPEQVVGSTLAYECQIVAACTTLVRQPTIGLVNDKAGKPVGIQIHIGRRPLFAAGNSDGDIQMLQYTKGRAGASFQLLVHHDDAVREYAYDRGTEQALDFARQDGWLIVSMERDWQRIFPFERK